MNISYTAEQATRVMSKLGISFTTASVVRLVKNSKLKKVPRPSSRYNTSFNYLVCLESLQNYLVNEVGLDANIVYQAIYGTGGQ